MSIRLRIKEARENRGLSKSELARRCGVTPSAAIEWEREGGNHPSVEKMERIAVELGVAFEWLATGRGPQHVGGSFVVAEPSRLPYAATLDPPPSPQARAEQELVDAFRKLPDEARRAVLTLLSAWPRRGRQDSD